MQISAREVTAWSDGSVHSFDDGPAIALRARKAPPRQRARLACGATG